MLELARSLDAKVDKCKAVANQAVQQWMQVEERCMSKVEELQNRTDDAQAKDLAMLQ
jgi:hypothetical protein